MKLVKVGIQNFRSIKDITVQFTPSCRVLVGINESGKSNILNALAFADPRYTEINRDDVREGLPNEPEIKVAAIRFFLSSKKENLMNFFND